MSKEYFLCVEKWGKLGYSGAVYKSEADTKKGGEPTFWVHNQYPYFESPQSQSLDDRGNVYTNKKQEKIVELFKKGLEARFESENRQSVYYKGTVTVPVEVIKL